MLTRLPLGPSGEMGTGAAAFPLVGAVMGAVAALPILALAPRDALVAAALSVAALAVIGGALHLDGLADCADYLAAPDPSSAERARRDPRVGAAGAAAVSLVLIVQVACLAALAGTDRWLAASALIAGCTASRATVATLARWVTHRREGLGAWFAEGTSAAAAATSAAGLVVVVGVAALAGRTVLPVVAALIAVAVGTVALVGLARVQSGATGDAYGAAIELGLTAGLVTAAVVRP
ncbi:MAG: adenosylcobinamide-GDP ribazoletransferase [Chloroflexota bacterium]|jgi:adenosylcobinamide-GDP ribazoletransferase|nr:adenosylcobinamide-GDP ribazoletransferase [Chloroflexota bacterium]